MHAWWTWPLRSSPPSAPRPPSATPGRCSPLWSVAASQRQRRSPPWSPLRRKATARASTIARRRSSRSTFVGSDTSNREPARAGLRGKIGAAVPKERFGDHLAILSGTGQNIIGLGVFVAASLGSNVLTSREMGPGALGVITLATQFAFVGGAATRFGMDVAAVRRVAIDVGRGEPGRVRAIVARAAVISAVASVVVGVVVFALASNLASGFGAPGWGRQAFQAAALAIPFVALCQVYLGGTQGLKIMRHTVYIFWAGQPAAWIALMVAGWIAVRSVGMSVLAYAVSWLLATVAAWWAWERETANFARVPAEPGTFTELIRYGAPRAPAALLAQLLFWTDFFVAAHYVP